MELEFTLNDSVLEKIIRDMPNKVEEAMLASAILIADEVNDVLRGQRHGRRYRVPRTKRYYTASAPNEAPAVRLGDLFGSYKGTTEGSGSKARAVIGTDVKYAPHLEYGTHRIAPRPHFKKTMEKNIPKVEEIVRNLFDE